jgi:hypothetical protein
MVQVLQVKVVFDRGLGATRKRPTWRPEVRHKDVIKRARMHEARQTRLAYDKFPSYPRSPPLPLTGAAMPPQLASAFLQCNQNAINLFARLQKGGVQLKNGKTYSTAQFVKEWSAGGKTFLESHWRDPANTAVHAMTAEDRREMKSAGMDDDGTADAAREMYQGKHEWIPTNLLGYVAEWGIGHYNDIRWIYLAEVLRIPTRLVVIHPRKIRESPGPNDPLGLHGHVGALYLKGKGRSYSQRIKGQPVFHNALRDLLRDCLSITTNDRAKYIKGLEEHIEEWYWTGDLSSTATACHMTATAFAALPCPYSFNSGAAQYESWGATMGDMAAKLAEGWALWNKINQNQVAAGLTMALR